MLFKGSSDVFNELIKNYRRPIIPETLTDSQWNDVTRWALENFLRLLRVCVTHPL